MIVESFFKISIIDGALHIQNHRMRYPHCSVEDAVRQLRQGPAALVAYDYERAQLLADVAGWDAFCNKGTRQEQLQETLKRLVIRLRPLWARFSHLGRTRVLHVMNADQRQCLQYAGLLAHPTTVNVTKWWQEIGTVFRALEDAHKSDIGRQGEQLTIERERRRLAMEGIAMEPIWVALDDITAGYDVLSYRKGLDGATAELRIEVKACSFSPTHFVLSRNEWNAAARYGHAYQFHIWNLDTGAVTEMTVPEMAVHIPENRGVGQWESLRVTLGSQSTIEQQLC